MTWLASYLDHRKPQPGGGRPRYDWFYGRQLWDQGVVREAIAVALGCSLGAVDKRRRSHDWPKRQQCHEPAVLTVLPTLRRCEDCEQLTPTRKPCQSCGAAA